LVHRVSVPSDRVAVIGSGASSLLPVLVGQGYVSIDAVDVSGAALEQLSERLGDVGSTVRFVEADARLVRFDTPIDVWHDRATFHFLTDPDDQAAYVSRAADAVRAGGHVVLATFAPDGPEQCSGLPVQRHDLASLVEVFGPVFVLVDSFGGSHVTPWGSTQAFLYCLFRRNESN
jgi:SAM-dependent methyltransferase